MDAFIPLSLLTLIIHYSLNTIYVDHIHSLIVVHMFSLSATPRFDQLSTTCFLESIAIELYTESTFF